MKFHTHAILEIIAAILEPRKMEKGKKDHCQPASSEEIRRQNMQGIDNSPISKFEARCKKHSYDVSSGPREISITLPKAT